MSVMAQYWPATVYTISAGYHFSIGPIQGPYNFDCNGPVLALYSLYGIGPVPILYRADTGPIRKRKNLEKKINLIYNYETLPSNVKLYAL